LEACFFPFADGNRSAGTLRLHRFRCQGHPGDRCPVGL